MTRDELVAQHICVACQRHPAIKYSLHCKHCVREMFSADSRAIRETRADVRAQEPKQRREME